MNFNSLSALEADSLLPLMHTATLRLMERDELITANESRIAQRLEARGTPAHTIGAELEILPSAIKDLNPRIRPLLLDDVQKQRNAVSQYGYELDEDGVYELSSPPALHPLALSTSILGMVRKGFLPASAAGVVTAHVSIGTPLAIQEGTDEFQRLVRILRITDMLGGTTVGRLVAPLARFNKDQSTSVSWNQKGRLGVHLMSQTELLPGKSETNWVGSSHRVEFRTARYRNPVQIGWTLRRIYLLSRAALAPASSAGNSRYTQFEIWYQQYAQDKQLPDTLTTDRFQSYLLDRTVLEDYLLPYAQLMTDGNTNTLRKQTTQLEEDLSEEYGLNTHHSN